MELLDIADEFGNLTGEVMEREKAHDLNLLHWEISVYIINNKKQVLLQKRAATKRYNPNKWGSCAGHVLSGETLEDTALREIEEEIGLKFTKEDLKILDKMQVRKRDNNSHIARSFYVVCNKDIFNIQKEELSEVKWFNIEDVINMIKNNDDTITFKMDRLYLLEKLYEIEV